MKKVRTYIIMALLSLVAGGCSSPDGKTEPDPTPTPEPTPTPTPTPDPEPEPEPTFAYEDFLIPTDEDASATVRAFPGIDGGGINATGGRGGTVLHVTSLADDGSKGTLRWAVQQSGARTIVFDVAGTIALKSRLDIKNGDLTIAGQTAPGDGICIRDNNFRINTSNVIIRFLRFRLGDVTEVSDDALNCYTGSGNFSNIVIDHCSMSWCTDECGSFYGIKGLTVQYCILSESLRNSVHEKGSHGYGGLWGGADASYHHNLLAHHDSRNPRFSHDYLNTEKGPIHFYNNVVYNWGSNSAYGGEGGKDQEPRQINMVNNYYRPGPATPDKRKTRLLNPTTKCSNCNKTDQKDVTPGKFWVTGNVVHGSDDVTADNWKGVEPDDSSLKESLKASAYQGTAPERLQTAKDAFSTVLAVSGASLKRDAVDARIVKETLNGTFTYTGGNGSTGGLIDSQKDVGGWPELAAMEDELSAVKDSDGDGIPDAMEDKFGLNKNDASDGVTKTLDKYGRYTNLEMYLHYLVRDIVKAQFTTK